jgi:hypothetical protein
MTEQVKDYDKTVGAEAGKRAFRFQYEGREWSMRHIRDFDWRLLREGAIGGDMEAVDKVFRKGMGKDQYADWEQVEQSTALLDAIFDDYLEHCGLSRGKSESSTDSSETTEKPSKRASKPRTRSTSPGSTTARSRRAASSS